MLGINHKDGEFPLREHGRAAFGVTSDFSLTAGGLTLEWREEKTTLLLEVGKKRGIKPSSVEK